MHGRIENASNKCRQSADNGFPLTRLHLDNGGTGRCRGTCDLNIVQFEFENAFGRSDRMRGSFEKTLTVRSCSFVLLRALPQVLKAFLQFKTTALAVIRLQRAHVSHEVI